MVNETISEYTMPNGAKSCAYNADCVEKMREYPDGYFDLAVVDPPYGGGGTRSRATARRGSAGYSTNTLRANGRRMVQKVR